MLQLVENKCIAVKSLNDVQKPVEGLKQRKKIFKSIIKK